MSKAEAGLVYFILSAVSMSIAKDGPASFGRAVWAVGAVILAIAALVKFVTARRVDA